MAEKIRDVVSMCRVSTPGQAADDKKGLVRQQNDIKAFCDVYNLHVVKEFSLVVSGSDVQRTKAFNEMLSYLKRNNIAGVVVPSTDRMLRLVGKLSVLAVFKIFEDTGKRLFCDLRGSDGDGLDLNNPTDALMFSIKVQMAGMEKMLILHRTKDAREELQEDEHASVNKRPKGVAFDKPNPRVNNGTFRYEDFATGPVKEAFARFLRGETLFSITEKVRWQGQQAFPSVPRLRYVLKNEWWIGYKTRLHKIVNREWDGGKEKWVGGKRKLHEKPIRKRTNLADAPLISPADFQRVQELLAVNHDRHTKRTPRINEFLAEGLMYCQCGAFMYHIKGINGRGDRYKCSNRHTAKTFYKRKTKPVECQFPIFKAKDIDNEIALQAQMHLGNKKTGAVFVEDLIRESGNKERQDEIRLTVQIAQEKVADLEKRIKRLRDRIEESDDPELGFRLKERRGELETAKDEVRSAQAELQAVPDELVKRMAAEVQRDFEHFAEQPRQTQKDILKRYVERITPRLNEVTDAITVGIKFKGGFPTIDEDYAVGKLPEPIKPSSPIRVKKGGNIGGVEGLRRITNKNYTSIISWTRA